jgi:predicted ATP-dependent endonuclease of OLD family
MLTRIEIDGFKTFRDFALDVPPFLVVLGRNASGKSNLFDAIQFLRASRSRISRVRWLRADALPDPEAPDAEWGAEDEGVSPYQIVSDSEVAEFEVRNGLAA